MLRSEDILAWATGVHNGKQPDSSADERKEAAILQPEMQQDIYMSTKSIISLSECNVEKYLKCCPQLIKVFQGRSDLPVCNDMSIAVVFMLYEPHYRMKMVSTSISGKQNKSKVNGNFWLFDLF